jgi:hypothetical protein
MDENHDILEDASKAIRDRNKERGPMPPVYAKAAKIASVLLGLEGRELTASDVIHVMLAVKLARGGERDNLVDIAGYAQGLMDCRRHEEIEEICS